MADSITDLFIKRQPSMQDVSSALFKSLSSRSVASPSPGVSFGEALNNIRGAKIKEAMQFEGVKQSRRKIEQTDEALGLQKQKFTYKQIEDAATRGDKNGVEVKNAIKELVPEHLRDVVADKLGNLEEEVTAANAYQAVGKVTAEMRKGGAKFQKPRTPSSADDIPYVVTDTRGEEAIQFTIPRSQVKQYSGIPGLTVTSANLQGGTKDILTKARQRKLGGRSGEAETSAVARSGNIAKISGLLDQYERAGAGVAGLSGAAAHIGASVLGQFNQAAAEGWSEFFSGVSQAELTNLRTRAREAIARAIAPYSGEESGRFSEPERQLAETAQPLLEADATWEQISSALQVTISLEYITRDREIGEAGQPQSFDLLTPQGRAMMAQQLEQLGLKEAAAAQTIMIVIKQRALIAEATGAARTEQ